MTEDHRKHLEFIQLIVTRMNANSFQLKGWSVAVVAALSALTASEGNKQFVWIAMGSIVFFWMLDAWYLRLERAYRVLFDKLRAMKTDPEDPKGHPYSMSLKDFSITPESLFRIALRPVNLFFHGPLLVAAGVASQLLARHQTPVL